jgi:hypothetical protein
MKVCRTLRPSNILALPARKPTGRWTATARDDRSRRQYILTPRHTAYTVRTFDILPVQLPPVHLATAPNVEPRLQRRRACTVRRPSAVRPRIPRPAPRPGCCRHCVVLLARCMSCHGFRYCLHGRRPGACAHAGPLLDGSCGVGAPLSHHDGSAGARLGGSPPSPPPPPPTRTVPTLRLRALYLLYRAPFCAVRTHPARCAQQAGEAGGWPWGLPRGPPPVRLHAAAGRGPRADGSTPASRSAAGGHGSTRR